MKRFIISLAIPALTLMGCSSEEPQRSVHVSGSASVTPPTGDPKVVGSEVKAGSRGTTEIEEYHARDNADRTRSDVDRTRTDVDVRTRTETAPRSDVDRSTETDTRRVKPVDTDRAGQPDIKSVDGSLSPAGTISVKAPANGSMGYFETTKDGKTYVFSSSDAMKRFNDGDTSIRFTTKTGPNGERYFVESDHADTLSAEYGKAHPGK